MRILVLLFLLFITETTSQAQVIPYVAIIPSEPSISRLVWSPTSEYLAISSNNRVSIFSDNLEMITSLPEIHTDLVLGLTWSPDNDFLATSGLDGNIYIWDVANFPSVSLDQTLSHGKPIWGIQWSKAEDDSRLLSVVSEGFLRTSDSSTSLSTLNLWDTRASRLIYTSNVQYHGAEKAEWSYDGRYIAYPNYTFEDDYNIRVWDTIANTQTTWDGNGAEINDVAWDADTYALSYADDINFVSVVDLIDFENPIWITSFESIIDFELYSIDWSYNHNFIVTAGTQKLLIVWDVQSSQKTDMVFEPHQDTVMQVVWSPNNKYIASVDRGGNVRVWDMSLIP